MNLYNQVVTIINFVEGYEDTSGEELVTVEDKYYFTEIMANYGDTDGIKLNEKMEVIISKGYVQFDYATQGYVDYDTFMAMTDLERQSHFTIHASDRVYNGSTTDYTAGRQVESVDVTNNAFNKRLNNVLGVLS